MKVYAEHVGSMEIPEEKRLEFYHRLTKILNQGGMFSAEEIKSFGRELYLLVPPQLDKDGEMSVGYNYFEDQSYDYAHFSFEDFHFCSADVGCRAFCETNTCYKYIFAHKEMFEDFLRSLNTAEAQAAVILLSRLVERNMEYFINLKGDSWYFIPKKQKRSPGRLQIKRYLAIMDNRQLRKILFDF